MKLLIGKNIEGKKACYSTPEHISSSLSSETSSVSSSSFHSTKCSLESRSNKFLLQLQFPKYEHKNIESLALVLWWPLFATTEFQLHMNSTKHGPGFLWQLSIMHDPQRIFESSCRQLFVFWILAQCLIRGKNLILILRRASIASLSLSWPFPVHSGS